MGGNNNNKKKKKKRRRWAILVLYTSLRYVNHGMFPIFMTHPHVLLNAEALEKFEGFDTPRG